MFSQTSASTPERPLVGIRGWLIDAPEPGKLRSWTDGALIIDGAHIAEVAGQSGEAVTVRLADGRTFAGSHLLVRRGGGR